VGAFELSIHESKLEALLALLAAVLKGNHVVLDLLI
jgi:hypothetical protein